MNLVQPRPVSKVLMKKGECSHIGYKNVHKPNFREKNSLTSLKLWIYVPLYFLLVLRIPESVALRISSVACVPFRVYIYI